MSPREGLESDMKTKHVAQAAADRTSGTDEHSSDDDYEDAAAPVGDLVAAVEALDRPSDAGGRAAPRPSSAGLPTPSTSLAPRSADPRAQMMLLARDTPSMRVTVEDGSSPHFVGADHLNQQFQALRKLATHGARGSKARPFLAHRNQQRTIHSRDTGGA